jgi:hypothetical protein
VYSGCKQIERTVVLVALFVFISCAQVAVARSPGNIIGFDAISSEASALPSEVVPLTNQENAQPVVPLTTIKATGRVVFSEDEPIEDLRRRSLSEALYFAALQGGARVNGFSSVDQSTMLTEQILVRPSSNLLDYRILSEERRDLHYEVTIEAVIGDPDPSDCKQTARRTVTLFAPNLSIAPNVSAWAQRSVSELLNDILADLKSNPNIIFRNKMKQKFKIENRRLDDEMDYASIMNSSRVFAGDFAIVPSIKIFKEEDRNLGLFETSYYRVIVQINIYEGQSYQLLSSKSVTRKVFAKVDTFLDPINVLVHPDRSVIIEQLASEFKGFTEASVKSIMCAPLKGELKAENGRYLVEMGSVHGLTKMNLAILSSDQQPWTVLRVSSLEGRRIFLTPLDPSRDLSAFAGQTVRFLEAHYDAN